MPTNNNKAIELAKSHIAQGITRAAYQRITEWNEFMSYTARTEDEIVCRNVFKEAEFAIMTSMNKGCSEVIYWFKLDGFYVRAEEFYSPAIKACNCECRDGEPGDEDSEEIAMLSVNVFVGK